MVLGRMWPAGNQLDHVTLQYFSVTFNFLKNDDLVL
jgi:hypothetical protein